TATGGNLVAYYIEAEGEDETPVVASGTEEQPHTISLRGTKAPAPGGCEEGDPECGEDDDDIGPRFFLGLAGGAGFGYATGKGEVDVQHRVNPPGFAPFPTTEIAPEVGFMIAPRFRLSLQMRFQFVSGATPVNLQLMGRQGCGSDNVCQPANSAVAVFARGAWLFGEGKLR